MQYRFHNPRQDDDVEYFEPRIEPSHSAIDIAEFIDKLGEPERSICASVVLDGENVSRVAATHGTSCHRINRILRSSLRPLAEDLDIVPKRKP